MSTQASNRGAGPSSLSGMLATLIPTGLVALAWLGFFIVMRTRQRRIYEPRTYLANFSENERTPRLSTSRFGWIKEFLAIPDEFILTHHSLDGYLWIRYLKMLVLITAVGLCVCWPILFPVYATGHGGQEQFNILSLANVVDPNRYYATTFVSWIFLGFVLYLVGRESMHFIALRQAYLTAPLCASRMSSRTVLFTDVPERYLDEGKIRTLFKNVKHVWLATDCKDLQDLIKERDKTAMKLESGECALSRNANTRRLNAEKKRAKGKEAESLEGLQWIDEKKRPTHKLGFLGCCGEKVDTIEWSREHLKELIPMVEKEQEAHWNGKSKYLSACFVEFDSVSDAQLAFTSQVSHLAKRFQPRCIGVRPDEIIWANLNKSWFMRDVLKMSFNFAIGAIIIFWAIPISFGGFISNIQSLSHFSWLSWVNQIPSQILGIITGLIPVVWIAVLMALFPIVCRLLAKIAGAASVPEVELTTQNWYFAFQVVNVFLITTFASGASGVLGTVLSDPSQAPTLLAQALPTASNVYISYFILNGTAFVGAALANAVALLLFYALGYILDKTPRKKFARYTSVGGIGWGSTYPPMALLGVIVLAYSTIAPLVLGFAVIGQYLIYLAFRYNMIYTLDTSKINTQGAAYGRGLQHLMVGVYLAEVCLVGLFAIKAGNEPAAVGPMILMIIFLVFTIFYHIYIRGMIKPMARSLPRDLLTAGEGKTNISSAEEGKAGIDSKQGFASDTASPTETNGGSLATDHASHTDGLILEKQQGKGPKAWLFWLLHPNHVPSFPDFFYHQSADYSEDVRREAYLDPSIISPTPSLWIIHDEMGISEREKIETGKVIGITDGGAWFNEKGKLTTVFTDGEAEQDPTVIEKVPVYEAPVRY